MENLDNYNYILNILTGLKIDYRCLSHPPILNVEEGQSIAKQLGVKPSKCLFLCNRQQEYFLLMLPGDKNAPLKKISKQISSSHLSLVPKEEMEKLINTQPGAVSPLSLIYDKGNQVQLLIDEDIIKMDYIACHPGINTYSLLIKMTDILQKLLPSINKEDYKKVLIDE